MIEILEFCFRGFWTFLGILILGGGILSAPVKLWTRFMRMLMIRKHGWPPPHLDADGDWPSKED